MALKPCNECGKEVSTSGRGCPHCGAKPPSGLPTIARVGIVVGGILIASQWVSGGSTASSPSSAETGVYAVDTTLSFPDIRRQMRETMTEAQFKAMARGLEGRRIRWRGWIEDVNEKGLGGYEVWIDMDSPTAQLSVQEVTFDVPDEVALALQKNAPVEFEGTISGLSNILGSLQVHLTDGHLAR